MFESTLPEEEITDTLKFSLLDPSTYPTTYLSFISEKPPKVVTLDPIVRSPPDFVSSELKLLILTLLADTSNQAIA